MKDLENLNPGEINGALLAYLGDAQIELYVRKRLVLSGGKLGELNKAADGLVSAKAQCRALEKLLPLFTEAEHAVFKRGKNVHVNSVPKSAAPSEYRKATGLEAVFGYLCITGEEQRTEYLIDAGFFSGNE